MQQFRRGQPLNKVIDGGTNCTMAIGKYAMQTSDTFQVPKKFT